VKRLALAFLCASASVFGSTILVTDPSLMNTSSDYINWVSQFSDNVAQQSFYAYTSLNEQTRGLLDSGTGMVVAAGSASWKNGAATMDSLNPGDHGIQTSDEVLRTSNGTTGDAPLSLSFKSAVNAAGAYIQADGFSQFTARIQAFAGFNSVFDMTVTSDAKGDAVFLGVADDTREITKIVYSLTSAPKGYSLGDFAVDTVYLVNGVIASPPPPLPPVTTAPEPGMAPLLGLALLTFGLQFKKYRARI